MANKAQLIVSSSQTYYNNTAGNITPDSVNAFNTTWINSSVLNENSASFMVTASAQASTITFTNGDGSTYLVQIAQSGSSVSASYAVFADTARSSSLATSASFALRGNGNFTGSFSGSISASFSGSGVGIFGIVSSSYAVTASLAINASTASFLLGTVASASYAINADLLDGIDSTGYAKTGSNTFNAPNTFQDGVVLNNITAQAAGADGGNINITPYTASKVVLHNNQVTSGSITIKDQLTGNEVVLSSDNTANTLAVNGNIQANSPYSFVGNATQLNNVTASLVNTLNQTVTISGSLSVSNNTTLANVTASNIKITGTASIEYLDVVFQSSSIIYSSGSNQFGDASNDTQTLWGTVNVISGPLVVTGSANFKETITGSISGNAATATSSTLLSGMPSSSFATTGSNLFKGDQTITGSSFVQQGGVFSIYNNDATTAFALSTPAQLASITVPFAATSGITGNLTGTASFATYALNAGSIFPFTGSAAITGSLNVVGALNIPSGSLQITGSATIFSGSLTMFSYKSATPSNRPFEAMVTQSLDSNSNIISIASGLSSATGSIVISGSGNYIAITSLPSNTNYANGQTVGFNGANCYLTNLPVITGSNPLVNTTADRNNRFVPTLSNCNINSTLTITDNRLTETSRPINFTSVNVIGATAIRIESGSLTGANSIIGGASNTFEVSSSSITTGVSTAQFNTSYLGGSSTNIIYRATGSSTAQLNASIINGSTNRIIITGSSAFAASVTNPQFSNSLISGNTLITTGSNSTGASITILGNFNTADGLLNDARFTTFAVGTGGGAGTRRTSFHVSASGMVTCFDGLTVTGSQVITGSLYGSPVSQSVSSLTASLNLRAGNFFNLTLPASVNTYITASGQLDGQTINLKITQGATSGSVSLGAGIKQVSGSSYTVTAAANTTDILTFISFDNTGLYVSSVKNLI